MKKTASIILSLALLSVAFAGCEFLESIADRPSAQHPHASNASTGQPVSTGAAVQPGNLDILDAYACKSVPEAKAKAISTGRPLLLVTSMDPCAHCDNFERLVLNTEEFSDFIRKTGIVVCPTRDNTLLLYTQTAYRDEYGAYFSGAPIVYMFKIRDNADCSKSDYRSFYPDQAEPLKSAKLDKYFMGSYRSNEPFMGIDNGQERSWSPETFIRQIRTVVPEK